jgi:hypothetical protein
MFTAVKTIFRSRGHRYSVRCRLSSVRDHPNVHCSGHYLPYTITQICTAAKYLPYKKIQKYSAVRITCGTRGTKYSLHWKSLSCTRTQTFIAVEIIWCTRGPNILCSADHFPYKGTQIFTEVGNTYMSQQAATHPGLSVRLSDPYFNYVYIFNWITVEWDTEAGRRKVRNKTRSHVQGTNYGHAHLQFAMKTFIGSYGRIIRWSPYLHGVRPDILFSATPCSPKQPIFARFSNPTLWVRSWYSLRCFCSPL